ncbi:MAG: alcohol dehydrogenase catalytic domain-containing protein [Armatimonadia bacterium]
MWALRVHGPNDLRMEEVPQPQAGPGEVVVRVAAAGICHTDLEVISGEHGAILRGLTKYSITPGHEWAGYVTEVGEGVEGLREGDLVVGETGIGCLRCRLCLTGHHNLCPQGTETGIVRRDGAMREYHVQRADFVHRFPVDDPELAALVEPASVGVYACLKTAVTPLDRVAVVGGGSIGQFCAQAAKVFGARHVAMVTRSEPKLRLARELGADETVNSKEVDLAEWAGLFDVVIEAAGTAGAFRDALQLGGYTSRIGVVGLSGREPVAAMETLIDREQTIIGVRGSPNVYPQTVEMLAGDALKGRPVISHRFGIDEYEEAFALARRGGAEVMKIMLVMGT